MRPILIKSVVFAFISTFLLGAGSEPTPDGLIDTYFKATGGKEAWRSITTMKMESVIEMPGMGMKFPVTTTVKHPNKLHILMKAGKAEVTSAFDGKEGWMINPASGSSKPRRLDKEELKDYDKPMQEYILDYDKKGFTAEYIGKEKANRIKCHKIKLVNGEGEFLYYWFDMESGLVAGRTDLMKSDKDETNVYYTSNYRTVENVKTAFTTETRVAGKVQSVMTVTKCEFNVEVSDELFAFPNK